MVDNSCTAIWSVMVDVQKIAEFSHLRVLASEQRWFLNTLPSPITYE